MRRIKGKRVRMNRPMPNFTLDYRLTRMSQCRDTHVAYSPDMLGGRIDREAWAREIDTLVKKFDDGNKSAFAKRINRTRQTVIRWLEQATDVSQESVREMLDRLELSQSEQTGLLIRVGYYTDLGKGLGSLIPDAPPIPQDPHDDPVIQQIMNDPRLTEEERLELVQEQVAIMDADRQRRMADYERMMRRLDGRRDVS